MKAEIITSGTELLLGEITDFNSPYLADQLAMLGIDLYYTTTVGDNFERYSAVLKQAWDRSDLIITTGGLGPTQGDITREVIAGITGEEMTVDSDLKTELIAFFASRGVEMPQNNIKQATLIPSAAPLHNTAGTAPGWWVEKDERIILALPGPPREMQTMWQNEVLPKLEKKSGAVILSRTLKTWGLTEGKVDELMAPFLSADNPTLGIYAKQDGIHLRITAKAIEKPAAAEMIEVREQEIRKIIGGHVWGVDDETIAQITGRLLFSRNLSLAVAESITGGMLAYTLNEIPKEYPCFKGGMVISGKVKASLITESSDARVDGSRDMASSMASLARAQFKAEIGLAMDGYYETRGAIGGGRVYVAIETDLKKDVFEQNLPGRPDQVVQRAINHALYCLRNFVDKL